MLLHSGKTLGRRHGRGCESSENCTAGSGGSPGGKEADCEDVAKQWQRRSGHLQWLGEENVATRGSGFESGMKGSSICCKSVLRDLAAEKLSTCVDPLWVKEFCDNEGPGFEDNYEGASIESSDGSPADEKMGREVENRSGCEASLSQTLADCEDALDDLEEENYYFEEEERVVLPYNSVGFESKPSIFFPPSLFCGHVVSVGSDLFRYDVLALLVLDLPDHVSNPTYEIDPCGSFDSRVVFDTMDSMASDLYVFIFPKGDLYGAVFLPSFSDVVGICVGAEAVGNTVLKRDLVFMMFLGSRWFWQRSRSAARKDCFTRMLLASTGRFKPWIPTLDFKF